MTQSSQSWKHPFLDSVTVRRVTQKEAGHRQEDKEQSADTNEGARQGLAGVSDINKMYIFTTYRYTESL